MNERSLIMTISVINHLSKTVLITGLIFRLNMFVDKIHIGVSVCCCNCYSALSSI